MTKFVLDRLEIIVGKGKRNAGYQHFLAHLSTEYSVSYCDHSLSVGVRPSDVLRSVHNFFVNTLASTNINQLAPNLVKMCMTIRFQMSSLMELIGPELSKLSALELENLPYLTFGLQSIICKY